MNVKKACSMGERDFMLFPIKLLTKTDIDVAKFIILRTEFK